MKGSTKAVAEGSEFRDKIGKRLVAAFGGDGGEWRTAGGIARETGLSKNTVEEYIQTNPRCFVRSRIAPAGKSLYAIRQSLRAQAAAVG